MASATTEDCQCGVCFMRDYLRIHSSEISKLELTLEYVRQTKKWKMFIYGSEFHEYLDCQNKDLKLSVMSVLTEAFNKGKKKKQGKIVCYELEILWEYDNIDKDYDFTIRLKK
jgi:hypothetical protein